MEPAQLDKAKWDEVVAKSTSLNLYCFSWYLDSVADQWGALVMGNYEYIMPVPFTIKKNQNILYQPFFSQQLNVLGKELPSVELINKFIQCIPEKFKLAQFNMPNYLIQDANGYEIEEVVFQYLDLKKAYTEINTNYSSNAKRQIKKAVKNGLTFSETDEIKTFLEMFQATVGEKLNFKEENYFQLKTLMDEGIKTGVGKLYAVKRAEKALAFGYFFIQEKRITYLKGASSDEGKNNGAMYFLMDEVIKKYASSGRKLDFGGSKVSSVAEFYKRLGGKDENYLSFSKNELPLILKIAKGVRDKFKK